MSDHCPDTKEQNMSKPNAPLSATMIAALLGATDCGVVREANGATRRALVLRGLAEVIRGNEQRRVRGLRGRTHTVYNVAIGTRLTPAGRELATKLATTTTPEH